MITWLEDWLMAQGVGEASADAVALAAGVAGVLLLATVANFIVKRIIVRAVVMVAARTTAHWDDILIRRKALQRLSHIAPAIIVFHFAPSVLEGYDAWITTVRQGCFIYMTVVVAWAVAGAIDAFEEIAHSTEAGRELPTRSFAQVAKIVLFFVTAIAVISIVIGQSPLVLFGGLGAMTAVLMLVFRDPILGFVAGIQLSANRMVSVGDWIEMPKYGADGDVMEVALTTVKVRNWDKTITTIPTYALISESFKNWRGMQQSGGRRIKRAIHIDMRTIRFCDEALLERIRKVQFMVEYLDAKQKEIADWNAEHQVDPSNPANGRRLTNVGTFRAYIVAYLRHHPMVNLDMTFLVRQLAPTAQGLPIEIYVFSRDQRWAFYEAIQADIFDHIIAAAPQFDLRLFQDLAGSDVAAAVERLKAH